MTDQFQPRGKLRQILPNLFEDTSTGLLYDKSGNRINSDKPGVSAGSGVTGAGPIQAKEVWDMINGAGGAGASSSPSLMIPMGPDSIFDASTGAFVDNA